MKFLRPLLRILAAIAMFVAPFGAIWLFCIFVSHHPVIGVILAIVLFNLLSYALCFVFRRCRPSLFWLTLGLTILGSIMFFFSWVSSF